MIDMEENNEEPRDGTTSGFAGYKHETGAPACVTPSMKCVGYGTDLKHFIH